MKFKKLESGRSMVEMLGVLAIIGVLSVGGIAGYSLSMRRHRANGIIDIASKYALVAYGRCQQEILNGDITDISECDAIHFSNAGVGASPTGLRSNMYISADGGFTTNQTTGVDTVTVYLPMEDTKLCQAVASVSGATCDNSNNAILQIKQN